MTADLDDVRALVYGDDELAEVCEQVLTVLAHSERVVETLSFNVVDVTVNQREHLVTVQSVLSGHDAAVQFSEDRFRELAETLAHPMTGDRLDEWRKRREPEVWVMPPVSD